eukprot:5879015-Amphidinium_carterae.1
MTSVAQPLDRSYMRTYTSLLRQHVGKHFAELFIANSEDFNIKKGLAANRALLPRWVEATMKELMQRADIHKL